MSTIVDIKCLKVKLCASPMLNQFLKMMNSENNKTQRRHNKFHILGLAKGGAVLAALVTDSPSQKITYRHDLPSPQVNDHAGDPTLTQINSVHPLPTPFLQDKFYILNQVISPKQFMHTSFTPCTPHALPISSSFICS